MPDYSQSKIYKITSPHTNKIYIGSTTLSLLCKRFVKHKQDYNTWKKRSEAGNHVYITTSATFIIDKGDSKIELLENCNCLNLDELLAKKTHYINLYKDICVNLNTPKY